MPGPSASVILDAWERGLRQPLQRQILALLAATVPGAAAGDIAALPLGERDALLFDLREQLFGPDVAAIAVCPDCGEQLEAGFPLAELRAPALPPRDGEMEIETGAHRISFRPPNTADLLAVPEGADAGSARAILLDRCIVAARDSKGKPVARGALPDALLPAIMEGMARVDPQAVVELDLACAACGRAFRAIFDIAGFLMREIHTWAQQMLRDIDSLARAYGWREADILALSPMRRQFYLGLVAR
jgi:hypothetical protein